MNSSCQIEALSASQRCLAAEILRIRSLLERQISNHDLSEQESCRSGQSIHATDSVLALPNQCEAIETVSRTFGLSSFERDILLMCVGIELDASFASLCGLVHGDPRRCYPTFSLAFAALGDGHWSAFSPSAPLRHWRLVEVAPGDSLMASPLRVDERTLHYLTGTDCLDERLQAIWEPITSPAALPISYRPHAELIANWWSKADDPKAVVYLGGDAEGGKRVLAAAACKALGLGLHSMRAQDVPSNAAERELLIRVCERETVFAQTALLIEIDDPAHARFAHEFAERMQGWVFVTGMGPPRFRQRAVRTLAIDRPSPDEQRALWEHALGPLAQQLNGQLDVLVGQFSLDVESIEAAVRTVRQFDATVATESVARSLWDACRVHARQPLSRLAQRIEPRARWDDLVLPEEQTQILREMAAHVRQRKTVYETWGFAARSDRGLGISALFAGPSGTGKTMAAEVIANELELDLFRIDLSQVVSKYIGDTEKNLSAVFDAAEDSGAILLFDEADALFGKRSEVKDSHDRYANIEVSYLLQRMESHRGLTILTTNQRGSLDSAFLRRLRFVVAFPFPDAMQRSRIWERIFPPSTPTDGLDFAKLSRLSVAGGNIRNIALNAAFLAADAGQPVRMIHLLHTARSECAKLEKPIAAAEIGGWV